MPKVFLGGTTTEDSTWREDLIPQLKIDYYNPVIEDWTEASLKEEEKNKDTCDIHLYVITPKHQGFYSFAEVIDSCHKKKDTVLVYLMKIDIYPIKYYNGFVMPKPSQKFLEFSQGMKSSMDAVKNKVIALDGTCIEADNIDEVADLLNKKGEQ